MPGKRNLPHYGGTIRGNGAFVESAEGRMLVIHSLAEPEVALLGDGTAVVFYDHHDKTGNRAAGVREARTKLTPCLAKGSEEKTS